MVNDAMKQALLPVRFMLLLLASLIAHSNCAPAFAQPGAKSRAPDPFELEARTFADPSDTKKTLPYRFLMPRVVEKDQSYPLVLYLHGIGSRGTDNKRQLFLFQPLLSGLREKYPCFVLAPQCPQSETWATFHSQSRQMRAAPTTAMALVKALVDETLKDYPVDPRRVYVTGNSMGGFGTFEFIQRWPKMIAAAAPVASGGDVDFAKTCADVPLWVFHGSKDTTVRPDYSSNMVDALKAAGGEPRFTLYPDAGHTISDMVYGDPSLLEWMFAQRRPEPKVDPQK